MTPGKILSELSSPQTREYLKQLYGNKPGTIEFQKDRYQTLIKRFVHEFYESEKTELFSTPGRTEVGRNHTDHNAGRVLAAPVDLDIIAMSCPSEDGKIVIHSEGYPEISVNIKDTQHKDEEIYSSAALVRGVNARLIESGYKTGGFHACFDGRVPKGSGLSSSAAFEVLVATILNHFYNGGKIDNTSIAQIAQYSENKYFGKLCGLMDQTACAYGGLVFIDFKNFAAPVIEKINYDFSKNGYTILIIDTGGNHADLNEDYTTLEYEMKSVAKILEKNVLREISSKQVL